MNTITGKHRKELTQTDKPSSEAREPARRSVGLSVLLRILWLPGLVAYWLRSRRSANLSKAQLDHELRLYAEMFPGDFLHYGYFDDPQLEAGDVSFAALDAAQHRYAQQLLDLIEAPDNPVLDVGCGMGGLSFMLADQGYEVIPLTPDQHQVAHIHARCPDLKVIHGRFEDFVAAGYEQYFGTLITSESLQYLDLEHALPRIRKLLAPDGQWIVCDYFRVHDDEKTSGHLWTEFCEQVKAQGFVIRKQEDITGNVLPTLRFATLMAERFVQPVTRYTEAKLASKLPLLHYLFEAVFERLNKKVSKGMHSIDPQHFAAHKRYMRLVIEADK